MSLMRRLLSRKFVLGCVVCATSLPGARDQHLHKDHRALFTSDADDPPINLPPFAITTMVPLIDLDHQVGTTSVKKGSHLLSRRDSVDLPTQHPKVDVGSCFLMDHRLSHQGRGNQSTRIRPIVNMVYQHHWFSDNKNFSVQPPFLISDKTFSDLPKDVQRLLSWIRQPSALIEH